VPPPRLRLPSSSGTGTRHERFAGGRRGSAAGGTRKLGEQQIEALTIAMLLAPGVYARNRMFDFFSSAGGSRARMRASILRGIVPQLARATAITISGEARGGETSFVLRYRIPAMHLMRVVELSATELAALRLVADRGNIRCLPSGAGDRDLVAKALAKLMDGDVSLDVSRLAREIAPPGE
jgi:hypothetical protein